MSEREQAIETVEAILRASIPVRPGPIITFTLAAHPREYAERIVDALASQPVVERQITTLN